MSLKEDLQAEITSLEKQGADSLAIHHQCFGAAKALGMVIRKMDEDAAAETDDPDIGDLDPTIVETGELRMSAAEWAERRNADAPHEETLGDSLRPKP